MLEYTPQEIQQVYDYRALLGLRNAWLNSKTVAATKKKPKQKLAKSGKITDAAKVFEKIL